MLIHAGEPFSEREFEDVCEFARRRGAHCFPEYATIRREGIVGSVRIVDCVASHPSRWFIGPTALVIEKEYPEPFQPHAGSFGFFEVSGLGSKPIDKHAETCVQTSAPGWAQL